MKRRMMQMLMASVLVLMPLSLMTQMGEGGGEKKEMPDHGMMGGDAMGMQEMMGMHEMGMEMDGGRMEMMKMMKAADRLDLTPDQRKKIQVLHLQHQKEAIPILGRIQMAGVEIKESLMADPVDLEKVRTKTKEKYEAMAELEVSHHALQQQIKALLTPEQRQRLDEMMMERGSGMGSMMKKMPGSPAEKPKAPKKPKAATGKPTEPAPGADDPHGH